MLLHTPEMRYCRLSLHLESVLRDTERLEEQLRNIKKTRSFEAMRIVDCVISEQGNK
jgi:hypothetical protein